MQGKNEGVMVVVMKPARSDGFVIHINPRMYRGNTDDASLKGETEIILKGGRDIIVAYEKRIISVHRTILNIIRTRMRVLREQRILSDALHMYGLNHTPNARNTDIVICRVDSDNNIRMIEFLD